jgi:3-oxoacyl-[acyl-carrier protein] reductase
VDLGLKGRVALVAAASKGLGRACALGFAREGADVAICARNEEALRETEKEILAAGVRVHATAVDLATADGPRRFVEESASTLGRVDVLVNNAGGPPPGGTEAFDDDAYLRALELNLLSTIRLTRAALPHMRRGGWGRIVNIASSAAKQPIAGLALSNVSRPAVIGYAKTLATEIAREGITVNSVCPGRILTGRIRALAQDEQALEAIAQEIPAARVGTPQEFANVVVFLASEPASYVTGATIQVDGGLIRSLF